MFTPKVLFTNINLLIEVELFYQFLFNKELDWRKDILAIHPGLKQVYSLKNRTSRIIFIKNYLASFRKKEGKKIKKQKEIYRREWKKIEKETFNVLSDLIELNWPKSKSKIKAMLSVNPICPRFLDDWSFSIFYRFNIEKAKEVMLHESCHFLYFEKWKKVFPEYKKKTFEVPSLEWHLSEIIAPVLLNEGEIQKTFKKKAEFYKEHGKIRINGIRTPQYFSHLYEKYRSKGCSFADFIKRAYSEIRKRRTLFKKISFSQVVR